MKHPEGNAYENMEGIEIIRRPKQQLNNYQWIIFMQTSSMQILGIQLTINNLEN